MTEQRNIEAGAAYLAVALAIETVVAEVERRQLAPAVVVDAMRGLALQARSSATSFIEAAVLNMEPARDP